MAGTDPAYLTYSPPMRSACSVHRRPNTANGRMTPPKVDSDASKPCLPPIRWAGGKRLLVKRLLLFLPEKYQAYYEPMVGGGALFFSLAPKSAFLADINSDLINFLQVLKTKPTQLYKAIHLLKPDVAKYYSLRNERPSSTLNRAIRFFYLVRLSWNGLYRVNKQGSFNVPYGYREPQKLWSLEPALSAANVLRNANLKSGDFELTTATAKSNDLVYFDPPYPRGTSNGHGFARYSPNGFTYEDHKRLARHAARLADRGIHVLITEAARKEILQLYSDEFCVTLVRNQSLIAANSHFRRDAYEAIITSYDAPH